MTSEMPSNAPIKLIENLRIASVANPRSAAATAAADELTLSVNHTLELFWSFSGVFLDCV